MSKGKELARKVADYAVNTVLWAADEPRRALGQYERDMYAYGERGPRSPSMSAEDRAAYRRAISGGANAEAEKTAEAVAKAHAACSEAVNSRQDERDDELNRWHDDDRGGASVSTGASHGREDVR